MSNTSCIQSCRTFFRTERSRKLSTAQMCISISQSNDSVIPHPLSRRIGNSLLFCPQMCTEKVSWAAARVSNQLKHRQTAGGLPDLSAVQFH